MFHSIRNRLIALCVAITVVSMLALSLATVYVARQNTVAQVDEGNALVKLAGDTMEEVVTSVDRVTSIVREINIASQEQSTGIGEVNGAVNLMDQSTQQNSALVEEAAAAAQTLQEQAVHLAALVAEFKLEHDSTVPAAAPRRMMAAPRLAHDT